MERGRKVRLLRIFALFAVLFGGAFAFLTGTWRSGALGLSISAGLALFGIGELVRNEDRAVAVALTIIGFCGIAGHVAQIAFLERQ